MKLETYEGNLQELEADVLVLILDAQNPLFDLDNEALQERIAGAQAQFSAGKLSRELSFDTTGLKVGSVLLFSSELEKNHGFWENLKTFAARGLRYGAETGRPRVAFALNGSAGLEHVGKLVEGLILGSYSFEKYRQKPRNLFEDSVAVIWTTSSEQAQQQIERSQIYCQATNTARDLVNEPGAVVTPAALVRRCQDLAATHNLQVEIWDKDRLAQDRRVGLLAVGGGSEHPPFMATLSYQPDSPSDVHLVLVGKGVTFDSGGISIKPADKMHLMRGDMAGAGAVLGAMDIIGQLKPDIRVTAIVVTAENAPDGKSMRPGDILVYRNNKSVHIENTDAEGRLILADGLIHAGDIGATHILDVATLTGAAVRALGYSFTGLMGNNRTLINAVTRAGGNHGEAYWKLPLPAEYKEYIKSAVADVNNMGGPAAGAITAGLFLQEFVPAGAAWAHLDIAPTFWKEKAWKYFGEGASGVAARTLADLALNWSEHTAR
ncbi:leucyl aminopeptidase [bacterium]|nr:leucyl aminopeptidase [bacterium]